MRWPLILLVVLQGMLHTGCLTSPFPLDVPAAAQLDQTLEGIWVPVDPDPGDEPSRMHILVFNEHEYYIEFAQDTLVGDVRLVKPDQVRLRVFMTDLDGTVFANVQELGTNDKDYMFVKVVRDGGELVIHTVGSDLSEDRTFSSASELAAFFRDNADNDRLYDDDVVRYRKLATE